MLIQFVPWFLPFLQPCEYKSLCGGRGSAKSQQAARFFVLRMAWVFSDPDMIGKEIAPGIPYPYYPRVPIRIMSGRQFNVSLDQSVKIVMESFLQESGLGEQFIIGNKSIKHRGNGSVCFFQGIERNTDNIFSYERISAWWFEQAEFLTQKQMRIIEPTARHYDVCPITGISAVNEKVLVWNPKHRSNWAWQRFVEKPMEGDLHLHTTYKDNPFLPPNLLRQANYSQEHWPEEYQHVWLGMPDDMNVMSQVLSYSTIESCIDAWDMRPRLAPTMRTDMGLDIALGGKDFCCAVIRTGPIVHSLDLWKGERDLNAIARRAKDILTREADKMQVNPSRIYFDASEPMEGSFQLVDPPAAYEAVGFGHSVAGKDYEFDSDTTNGDFFAKRNMQMAHALRLRADRTVRLAGGDKSVDPWDCLFINPDIQDQVRLKSMLAQPTRRQNSAGRWELEKDAGDPLAKSPDEFDAMCLAFANDSASGLRAR